MENKQKKSAFALNFVKFMAVFSIMALTLVGCGDGGGGSGDAKVGTMVLTSELGSDESLPQWGTTTVTAEALRVDNGTEVTFSSTGGRIDNAKMKGGEATTTFYALDAGGQINITATTTDSLGNSLTDTITVRVEEEPFAITLDNGLPVGSELSQGGETTITATVYGSDGIAVADGTEVRFSATSGVISASVPTVSGVATATFNAASSGGLVTITAAAAGATAEATISVASGPATFIELVSVSPDIIGLRGTGVDEVATIIYNVKDGGGNPVSDGQVVFFDIKAPTGGGECLSAPGGECLSTVSAITVSGQVSVTLTSGTVAGVATVTASANNGNNTVSTETRITMGYGRPDQLHLGIAFEKLNVPGLVLFGVENNITAYIADRYSNPISAGNPVYFASACGTMALTDIDGVSTNLTNRFGQATATSITGNPIEPEGECRMLIWTEGEEAWVDSNANGFYDNGEPFESIGEPYIDSNNNGQYDRATETYFDLDGNGSYTPADNIWDADTFVWTDGVVRWSDNTAAPNIEPQNFILALGESQAFNFTVADIHGNPLPAGTTVSVTSSESSCALFGSTDFVIPDAVYAGAGTTDFGVSITSKNTTEKDVTCILSIEVSAEVNGNAGSFISGTLLAGADAAPPSATDDSVTTTEGGATFSVFILSNDDLGEEPTAVTSAYEEGFGTPVTIGAPFVTNSTGNSLTVGSDGSVEYTPSLGNVGTDVINYTITDSNGSTSSAKLTVKVEALPAAP